MELYCFHVGYDRRDLAEPGEKDSKLAFFLATAVADEVITSISNLKTGREMWLKLKDTYGVSTENQTYDLLINLFSATKGSNEKNESVYC